jgi:hypothetical protein
MERMYVVVLPNEVIGTFESKDDAQEYVDTMFGHLDDAHDDLTWSIKPLTSP